MERVEPRFQRFWPHPITPEQQLLAAKIRCGDLDGARTVVENLTAESRQKITGNSSLMAVALRENKPEFIRFLVEECNAELEKSLNKPVSDDKSLGTELSITIILSLGDTSITPLRYAARFEKTEAAVELLRLGANVNAVSSNLRRTALHDASANGTLVIVRQLIQHGADLTIIDMCGRTALMYGVDHVDVCRELIERGADVNAMDDAGDTALHHAVDDGQQNPEVVKLLLENGADLFKKNNKSYDAFCLACKERATDIVKVIRDNLSGDEVGYKALIRSHQLLGACYIDYDEPLSVFSLVAEALIEWKTAVRLREERSQVITGEDDIVSAPNSAFDNEVEVLSMVKFDKMRQDANKIYMQGLLLKEKILGPTHDETIKSVIRLTKFYIRNEDYGRGLRLMRHGFKLSRDRRVDSTLRCSYMRDLGCIILHYTTAFDKHAIDKSVDFNDVYKFLEAIIEETRLPVEPIIEDTTFITVNEILMLITLFLIKLFVLLEANEIDIVRFRMLVHHFVRLNLRSSEGRTVLMNAICPDAPDEYDWFSLEVDSMKLLLECRADTWETDDKGNSVLHLLAKSEQWILEIMGDIPNKETSKKVAEMLLAFGAHFDARNNEGFSAVDYLSSLGFKFSTHMTLQCLAAQVIRRHKIPYAEILTKSLVDFVQMH